MSEQTISPIFPLAGTVDQQRRKAKGLIDHADPTMVQIILALLSKSNQQQRLKADYLALYRQAEKERGQ